MKTLRSSIVTAVTALAVCGNTVTCDAHADNTFRSKCTFLYKKFKSEATVKKCGSYYKTAFDHKSCGNSESWVEVYPCTENLAARGDVYPNVYAPFPGATVNARARGYAGYSGNGNEAFAQSGTKTFRDLYFNCYVGDICAGSSENKTSKTSTAQPLPASNDYYRRAAYKSDDIVIDEATRTVTITNFRAVLRNHPESYTKEYSAIGLSVIKSADDATDSLALHDEAYYQSSVIMESRIMLKDGNLLVDGLFNNMNIQVKDSSGVQIAYITADKYIFEIEGDADISDVALNIGSDVGTTDYTILTRFNPSTNATVYTANNFANSSSVTAFSAYPNPVTGNALTVEAELNRAQNVTVELLDQQGVVLRSIYRGMLTANARRNFQVNAQGLARGTYYLRMRLANGVITRRLVK